MGGEVLFINNWDHYHGGQTIEITNGGGWLERIYVVFVFLSPFEQTQFPIYRRNRYRYWRYKNFILQTCLYDMTAKKPGHAIISGIGWIPKIVWWGKESRETQPREVRVQEVRVQGLSDFLGIKYQATNRVYYFLNQSRWKEDWRGCQYQNQVMVLIFGDDIWQFRGKDQYVVMMGQNSQLK